MQFASHTFVQGKVVIMESTNDFMGSLPINDLNLYVEMGNDAIRKGNIEQCLEWYFRGLKKAKELRNKEKEREISSLIVTLI